MADEVKDEKEASVLLKLKEMIPVTTPIIAIMGIAFTYYSYFYDIQKTPQLQTKVNIDKVNETENAYIVSVKVMLKNESKSRLEVVGNLGVLSSVKVKTLDSLDDNAFDIKVRDTLSRIGQDGFRIDRDMRIYDIDVTGWYQPINHSTWMQPQESIEFSFLCAVSKKYDAATFSYMIDFSTSKENINLKYVQEKNGDLNYRLYLISGNDTTNMKEIPTGPGDQERLYDDYKICRNLISADVWLKSK